MDAPSESPQTGVARSKELSALAYWSPIVASLLACAVFSCVVAWLITAALGVAFGFDAEQAMRPVGLLVSGGAGFIAPIVVVLYILVRSNDINEDPSFEYRPGGE